jgi:hypothetical protein
MARSLKVENGVLFSSRARIIRQRMPGLEYASISEPTASTIFRSRVKDPKPPPAMVGNNDALHANLVSSTVCIPSNTIGPSQLSCKKAMSFYPWLNPGKVMRVNSTAASPLFTSTSTPYLSLKNPATVTQLITSQIPPCHRGMDRL